jgi:hypothetical protein
LNRNREARLSVQSILRDLDDISKSVSDRNASQEEGFQGMKIPTVQHKVDQKSMTDVEAELRLQTSVPLSQAKQVD